MSWPTARLDQCTRIVGGATPATGVASNWDGDIPWATPKDLGEIACGHIDNTPRKITKSGLASCSAEILPTNSVLFSSRAPIGHVAINTVPMATNQGFKSFIPNSKTLSSSFLYWWLKANRNYLEGLGNGATFKEVSKAVVARVEIPLPPLDEQRRIASILDQADALRRKRREAIQAFDRLLPRTFIELFGDPITNPHGWPRVPLRLYVPNIDSGWSPTCEDHAAEAGEWGVLKLSAITTGRYDDTAHKALPRDVSPRAHLEVKSGDLLFTRKNTYDLVAACALVRSTRPRLMMSDLIFRLRINDNDKLLPAYLQALLSNPSKRRQVQKLAGGSSGSMPNISKARLGGLEIEVPPLAEQRKLDEFNSEVEALRALAVRDLKRLDQLFASLQHRAFSGEL